MPTGPSHTIDTPPRYAVVAPTYNHAGPLPGVLTALAPLGLTVIAVDDGSSDTTPGVLAAWAAADPGRVVVRHPENQGKAAALRSGFDAAKQLGFTHAATIDSDGQHSPADLNALLRVSRDHPDALIVGARARQIPGYPVAGRVGRWVSNRLVRLESGVLVDDSQSGMRVYPLAVIGRLGAREGRYAFETEILTRAGWAGVRVIETPISCEYRLPDGRVSHFRIGTDSAAAIAMHARLLHVACVPGDPVPRLEQNAPTGTLWRRVCGRSRSRVSNDGSLGPGGP